MGLKSTVGQQSSGQYFLTLYKNFTQLSHPLQKNIAKSAFFHSFASFQVNKCPLSGQMDTGA